MKIACDITQPRCFFFRCVPGLAFINICRPRAPCCVLKGMKINFPLLLQLAKEFGYKFFETSAKDNISIQEVKIATFTIVAVKYNQYTAHINTNFQPSQPRSMKSTIAVLKAYI